MQGCIRCTWLKASFCRHQVEEVHVMSGLIRFNPKYRKFPTESRVKSSVYNSFVAANTDAELEVVVRLAGRSSHPLRDCR